MSTGCAGPSRVWRARRSPFQLGSDCCVLTPSGWPGRLASHCCWRSCSNPVAIAEAPLFLLALLVVRGLPALLYRRATGTRHAAAAGLLQATTLTFVIVATQIGLATGKITPTAAASLLAAGLLSAALFPAGPSGSCPRAPER